MMENGLGDAEPYIKFPKPQHGDLFQIRFTRQENPTGPSATREVQG